MEQNIEELVASVKQEQVEFGLEPETKVPSTFLGRTAAENRGSMTKEASEAQVISDEIAKDIGVDSLEVSAKLEKIATEMSEAKDVDAIIKIASESGNNDLLNLKVIATSLSSIVIADIEA